MKYDIKDPKETWIGHIHEIHAHGCSHSTRKVNPQSVSLGIEANNTDEVIIRDNKGMCDAGQELELFKDDYAIMPCVKKMKSHEKKDN